MKLPIKRVTLGDALAQADDVCIDGYEMETYTYLNDKSMVTVERADEECFDFAESQEADLVDGRAFFDDVKGEEHEFVFTVNHPLGS